MSVSTMLGAAVANLGHPTLPDAIVAATALAHGLRLLTLDQSLDRIFQALALDTAGVKPKASR